MIFCFKIILFYIFKYFNIFLLQETFFSFLFLMVLVVVNCNNWLIYSCVLLLCDVVRPSEVSHAGVYGAVTSQAEQLFLCPQVHGEQTSRSRAGQRAAGVTPASSWPGNNGTASETCLSTSPIFSSFAEDYFIFRLYEAYKTF